MGTLRVGSVSSPYPFVKLLATRLSLLLADTLRRLIGVWFGAPPSPQKPAGVYLPAVVQKPRGNLVALEGRRQQREQCYLFWGLKSQTRSWTLWTLGISGSVLLSPGTWCCLSYAR